MTTQIKYLAFKGIEKKEQILFKSFLNLAKNELEYQVVVLKKNHDDEPDILILGDGYEFEEDEQHLQSLPTILIGNDAENDKSNYLDRPVQWSDFKLALIGLDINVQEVDDDGDVVERVLPSEIKFAINEGQAEDSQNSERTGDSDSGDVDLDEYGYELGRMSVDYNSFTNSDYVEVVDDVNKFNQQDGERTVNEQVVLVTDDESSSDNSVLIIETSAHETWNFTDSETTNVSEVDEDAIQEIEEDTVSEIVLEKKVGVQIPDDEQYWLTDNEIIVNHETLFYIKTQRGMIYSAKEPGLWPVLLQEGPLSKLPMAANWQPNGVFKAYSMSCLDWTNALMFAVDDLDPGLDEQTQYILEKWPQFDLIELDNSLLKLCTMMFVRAESVVSLMTKSGYSRSTVVGLINACHRIGILKSAEGFEYTQSVSQGDEGMLGRIKDVFK